MKKKKEKEAEEEEEDDEEEEGKRRRRRRIQKEEEDGYFRFNYFLIDFHRNRTLSRRCNNLSAFYTTRCLGCYSCSY
jgi:hypothetical protein